MGAPEAEVDLSVGDRIKFAEEVQRYTVRAVTKGGRFAICTKPFNLKRTVLYSVIDFKRDVRGTDDHYGLGYESDEDIRHALHRFQHEENDDPPEVTNSCGESPWGCGGRVRVSMRSGNNIPLRIDVIAPADEIQRCFT